MINTLIKILYKIAGNVEKYDVKYYNSEFIKGVYFKVNNKDYFIKYFKNIPNNYLYSFNQPIDVTELFPNEILKLEFLKAMENLNQACIECTKSQFISFADAREETDEID